METREKGEPPSARYRVSRVGLGSLCKFGCVLGALVSLVPSLLIGSGGLLALKGIRRLLESWQEVELRLLGQPIPIDVVSLLNLEGVLRQVQVLDTMSWLLLIAFMAATCLLGGLLLLVGGDLAGGGFTLVSHL